MCVFNKCRFWLVIAVFFLAMAIVHIYPLCSVFAREYTPVQAKLMAKRAAKVDALRRLAELVYGTMVDSETTVKDMVTESDRINSRLRALVRGAVEVDHHFYDDLSAEVTMEIEVGPVTDILGVSVRYDGKTFRETGFGAPPHIEVERTQAALSGKGHAVVEKSRASDEYGKPAGKTAVDTISDGDDATDKLSELKPGTAGISDVQIRLQDGELNIPSKDAGKNPEKGFESPVVEIVEKELAVPGPPGPLTPTVSIVFPINEVMSVAEDHIRVKATARSGNNEPVTDIWVQVNGRRLDYAERGIGTMNKDSKKIDGPYAEIDVTVFLSVRNNHIEVIASNSNGESVPETINVVYSAEELFKPDLYVLSIGVSNYTDETSGLGKLDYAHEDASAISRVFDNQEGQLYRNVHKRLLINEEANRVNILGGLNWLLKESTQKDTAVIFIAGHGINDERGNYYFLPYDGKLEKPWENGVKWFDFQDIVTSLPSKVVLMVDTCHSGSITGKRRGAADITNILRDLVNAESGVVVMAASTGNESSQESREWGHGAFTKALLEGLGQEKGKADADYDKDTAFTIKELDLFVTTRVKDLTDGTQHPTTEISKTLPNFPLSIKQE